MSPPEIRKPPHGGFLFLRTRDEEPVKAMSMAWVRQKKANVCHGCNEHCALGHTYDINDEKARVIRFYPTIGGKRITEYIGAEGDTVKIDQTCIKAYRDSPFYIATSIQLAREIAKQCDHYKKR